jgi:hypothetical protein
MERANDGKLPEAVLQQLAYLHQVRICVSAKDGRITLTGSTHGSAMKYMAEECARNVFGVKSVANNLDVMPVTGQPGDPFGGGDHTSQRTQARKPGAEWLSVGNSIW